jgi:hypothetical protein
MDFFDNLLKPSSGLGGAISGIGGMFDSFNKAAAAGHTADEYAAERNANLERAEAEKTSTQLKLFSSERKISATKGAAIASIGAAGFQQSGSGADILRESTQQGYLEQAAIGEQGAINEAGFLDAAKRAQEERQAAKGGIFGGIMGGILQGAGVALKLGGMFL